ncbi:Hsp70 family protein [Heliophilum fasciatum]|uniref:Chaperone protein DnaK n=1 Tax=Heliophilum fasciatum TaxID=35700 RepID=A0A4R2RPX5_9FIRM|nr:Hsp70 family protein [Heliophilum fasciatum]MCW2277515.1 molecular chaperone DnaK (HSP70) [Heliophilum fasciatum]TCP65194.1 molecular chaperone DnaK (HSP70) [Heliophilum fasciatum]
MARTTRYYVGIDFGTTNSSVARIAVKARRSRRQPDVAPEVLALQNGYGTKELVRTVLFFSPDGRVMTEEVPAFEQPERGVLSLKRKIMENRHYTKTINGRVYRAEELVGLFLQELLRQAELRLSMIERLVLSVPTGDRHDWKDVLLAGAVRCGIKEEQVWFVDEPIAVLWDYKDTLVRRLPDDAPVLVFDFGGGTLDLAVMDKGHSLSSTDPAADHHRRSLIWAKRGIPVGGDDLDEVILRLLIEKGQAQGNVVCQQINTELFASPERLGRFREHPVYARLKRHAELIKAELSHVEAVPVAIPPLLPRVDRMGLVGLRMERDEWVQAAEPIWAQIREGLCRLDQDLQANQGKSLADVQAVLLSGGSSQVPYVMDLLEEALPQARLIFDEHLQTRICRGNARYGRDDHEWALEDTVGVAIGVYNHRQGKVNVLIPENSTYPVEVTRRIATTRPEQRAIDIRPMIGKDGAFQPLYRDAQAVACRMQIQPVATVGDYERFSLTLTLDKSQRLQIRAYDHQFDETVGVEEIAWPEEPQLP